MENHSRIRFVITRSLLVAAFGLSQAMAAEFEVTGPDGRRILLKDDNTWSYVVKKADDKSAAQVLLRVERKEELANGCRYVLRMVNNLPYLIQSLVPEFSAYKASGVMYETVFKAFQNLKPTQTQFRDIQFSGVPCSEIARVQVVGADRCDMGDLQIHSPVRGQCLARVQLEESEVVRFTK